MLALSLALACDLRIASSTAQLGAVFHRVGLSGDFGLLWLLPRIVGPARAMQLLMEAEVLSSERAAALDTPSQTQQTQEDVTGTAGFDFSNFLPKKDQTKVPLDDDGTN